MKRRDLLRIGVAAGAGAATPAIQVVAASGPGGGSAASSIFNQPSPATTPFVDPLPVPPITQEVRAFLPDTASYPASQFPASPGFPTAEVRRLLTDQNGHIRRNVKFYEIIEEESCQEKKGAVGFTTALFLFREMPRPRIELGTRGFSVRCSTG